MTTRAVGNRRLLKLADILDKVDATSRKLKKPGYKQTRFVHPCGTPACAIGHWAAHNRRRGWSVEVNNAVGSITKNGSYNTITAGREEFDLDIAEYWRLFAGHGCGQARTGKEAAKFIRRFVAKRKLNPVKIDIDIETYSGPTAEGLANG